METTASGTPSKMHEDYARSKRASIVHALTILRDLQNARRFYPHVVTESIAKGFWNDATKIIARYEAEPGFEWLAALGRSDETRLPRFEDVSADTETILALAAGFALLQFQSAIPELASLDVQNSDGREKLVESCRAAASTESHALGDALSTLCITKCLLPCPKSGVEDFGEPRAAWLLCRYLQLILRLVAIATRAMIRTVPVSVTPLLVKLKARVESCGSSYPPLIPEGTQGSISWFLDVMLSGDFDEFSVDEYTNGEIQKVAVFIEELKLRYPVNSYQQTRAEEYFFHCADEGIEHYDEEVREANRRFEKYVRGLKEKQNSTNETGDPGAARDDAPQQNRAHDAGNLAGTFDQYFFWLWHSGLEAALPFARVDDLTETEAKWLHDYLWKMADDKYFIVDRSKEELLNAYNLNAVDFVDGFRVVGDGEANVHRTSLRECITDGRMDDWLDLCNRWPKGEWENLPSDWKGEDIYRWVDDLHEWSEHAVGELKLARLHAGVPNEREPTSDEQRTILETTEGHVILVTIQQAAEISHTPLKTLRDWKYKKKLPAPIRKRVGRGGRKSELWDWAILRPVLEELVGMSLPQRPQLSSSGTK